MIFEWNLGDAVVQRLPLLPKGHQFLQSCFLQSKKKKEVSNGFETSLLRQRCFLTFRSRALESRRTENTREVSSTLGNPFRIGVKTFTGQKDTTQSFTLVSGNFQIHDELKLYDVCRLHHHTPALQVSMQLAWII